MLYRFYVHKEKILLPVVSQTEEGFYVDEKPVQIFAVTDASEWRTALMKVFVSGNQVIPTPDASSSGQSVVLESLRMQKWANFEKYACMYTVHAASAYIKIYRTGKAPDGMWGNGNSLERHFDSRAPWHVIVDALAQDVMKQPEAYPVKSGGLMVLK